MRRGSIRVSENPRKCKSAVTSGNSLGITPASDAPSLKKISSQYKHRLVTIRTLRLADRNFTGTTIVLGLPDGMPMSWSTVVQRPLAS